VVGVSVILRARPGDAGMLERGTNTCRLWWMGDDNLYNDLTLSMSIQSPKVLANLTVTEDTVLSPEQYFARTMNPRRHGIVASTACESTW
jgi:hypothetical protein